MYAILRRRGIPACAKRWRLFVVYRLTSHLAMLRQAASRPIATMTLLWPCVPCTSRVRPQVRQNISLAPSWMTRASRNVLISPNEVLVMFVLAKPFGFTRFSAL